MPHMWTLEPHNTTPGRIQAILAQDVPSLRGRIQPGVGAHGAVSGSENGAVPQWIRELAQELDERQLTYDIY